MFIIETSNRFVMSRPPLRAAARWAASLVLLVACGEDTPPAVEATASDSGSGSDSSAGDLADEADRLAAELPCQRYFECGCPAGALGGFDSLESCIDGQLAGLRALHMQAEGLGLTFDPACTNALMARFDQIGCAADWSGAGPVVKCNMHVGDKQRGEPCTTFDDVDGDDCGAGLMCHGGVCDDPMPEYEAGDICYLSWHVCVGDAKCADLDNDGEYRCEAMAHAGDPCLGGFWCVESVCDPNTEMCLPLQEFGEPCGTPLEVCALHLWCASDGPLAGTCVEQPPPKGPGDPCVGDECTDGLSCSQASMTCETSPPYICSGSAVETAKP